MISRILNYYRIYYFNRTNRGLYYDYILLNISKNIQYNDKYLDTNFYEILSLVNPEKVVNKSYEIRDYGTSEIDRLKSNYKKIYQNIKIYSIITY